MWESAGAVSEVDIGLLAEDGWLPRIIARRVANTGSCVVTVPTGRVPGMYKLRVESSAVSAVHAETTVSIDPDAVPPAIMRVGVAQPIWHSRSRQRITWESAGAVSEVDIGLLAEDGLLPRIIARRVANKGSCVVTVPTGRVPGMYKLRVESSAVSAVHAEMAIRVDDEHRARCVRYARLLLGLPPQHKLPYPILRKVAMLAATD